MEHNIKTLENKTVIITGAAQRIGSVVSRYLHEQGMNIIIHYHSSQDHATNLQRELNSIREGSASLIKADLRQTEKLPALINEACQYYGQLDVLINNASTFYPTPIGALNEDQWEDLLGTNLKAPLFLSQAAVPYLTKNKGCIINMVDIHGQRPMKNHAVYSAAKAGLISLTRSLARELGPDIRVNGIAPGAILWPQTLPEEDRQSILSRTALKRCGEPMDVARAIVYLIRDATYTTGQILNIDGGRSLFI